MLEKIRNSNGYEGNKIVDLHEWEKEVWDRIPERLKGRWKRGFHPALHFQEHWKGIKEIGVEDLPEVVKKYPKILEALNGDM